MLDIISRSIEAHGGLDRWGHVRTVSATFQPSGLALQMRGQEAFASRLTRVSVETHAQRVALDPFLTPGQVGLYEPEQTSIVTSDGAVVGALNEPKGSFRPAAPWSDLQLIYFAGHALWTYFNLPFLLAREEFGAVELEPWNEGSETWRRVKVTFPSSIATLSSEQVLFFDSTGLLRREDYAVEVAGADPVAHYVSGYRTFDGFVYPTRRRIYPRAADGAPNRDVLIMAADLDDYRFD